MNKNIEKIVKHPKKFYTKAIDGITMFCVEQKRDYYLKNDEQSQSESADSESTGDNIAVPKELYRRFTI